MKVLCHFNLAPALIDHVRAHAAAGVDIAFCPQEDDATFQRLLPETEMLWHVLRAITAEHIEAAPRLRLIQKLGVGINTIAVEAARARGIAVCNTPGANTRSVAEMTLLLMLSALRQLPQMTRRMTIPDGWTMPDTIQTGLGELGGRTVGFVGFGAIPQMLAPWLAAMGAHIVYTSRGDKPGVAFERAELDALLARSDIVSLHAPLTDETNGFINRERLMRMKPGAILVNTARGAIVDETALVDALQSGPMAAAALDVFVQEPLDPGHPLLALPNLIATPHTAWLTRETLTRSLDMALDNAARLTRGEALANRLV